MNFPIELKHITICVAGSNGYIGKHLVEYLRENKLQYYEIQRPRHPSLLDVPNSSNDWFKPSDLAAHLSNFRSPVILNLAGFFVRDHNEDEITNLVSGNLEFPIKLFETAAILSLRKKKKVGIVNVGTSWEYNEQGEIAPQNLYACLKGSNANLLRWYCKKYCFSGINLKLNDTYGLNDTRSKLMPYIKSCIVRNQIAKLKSRNQQINLLHILDVINGLMIALAKVQNIQIGQVDDAFLCGAETLKLADLLLKIKECYAPALEYQFDDNEIDHVLLPPLWKNVPKLENWKARIDLKLGLDEYLGGVDAL